MDSYSRSEDVLGYKFYFDADSRLTAIYPTRNGTIHGRGISFDSPVEKYTIKVFEEGATIEEIPFVPTTDYVGHIYE